jgi:hypothetical protein
MPLDLADTPTVAQTQAALTSLPDGFAAFGCTLLAAEGVTADTVLRVAEALRAGAAERRELFPHGDDETRAMERLASILTDAAPRYPHPPKLPLSYGPAGVRTWDDQPRARSAWR